MQAVRDVGTRYSWVQVEHPVYVVDYHASAGQPGERWRLVDVADVLEVLEWVARHQRGRSVAVSLEVEDAGGFSLVQLTPAEGLRQVAGW
ncbi:hypothetical protein [Cellulomonas pakistanensis]|uniref:Uncharacterized protein n=1 Tax=Cellulomonas pakistanensis TaxID=992287 RepID=A0A919PF03_9CELL|nr:hypothetical protein [Cellulomonas pakistanensis]GIG36962.1 hypothetical protein Cpa01nite_23430 [Cellulomonas pakistanensis]